MKTIIAGVRKVTDKSGSQRQLDPLEIKWMFECLNDYHQNYPITEVISGTAWGCDKVGELWAITVDLPIRQFVPDWDRHGKAAGPIRNGEMAAFADRAICFWDGVSRGTKNMIDQMEKREKPVTVFRLNYTEYLPGL
jgi:hypothetical protein